MESLGRLVMPAAAALIMCSCKVETVQLESSHQLDYFSERGWIPKSTAVNSVLKYIPDSNRCTIESSVMPQGRIDGKWLYDGDDRWAIESFSPVVLVCEAGGVD